MGVELIAGTAVPFTLTPLRLSRSSRNAGGPSRITKCFRDIDGTSI